MEDTTKSRKHQLAFDCTPDQLAIIAQAAHAEGLALASYVRRVALVAARQQPIAA